MADESAESWTGDRAHKWVEMADALETQLAPVSDLLFEGAALQPGERVLDVGCGTGPTTRRAAALVAPGGAVVGADVSSEMIEAARSRSVADSETTVEWVVADAGTWRPDEPVDVVISRFGVMFFDDPGAAFANLAEASVRGGRLCLAVWSRREDSPMFDLPLSIALAELSKLGLSPTVPDPDSGPFSLGDPDGVNELLADAGWRDVVFTPRPVRLLIGGGLDPNRAADVSMQLGPARIVAADLDPDAFVVVHDAIAAHYAGNIDEWGQVVLDALVGIVNAVRP